MNKSMYRTHIRNKPVFRRAVIIRMCGNIGDTGPHMVTDSAQLCIIKTGIKSRYHHVRMFLLKTDARLYKFLFKQRIAQKKYPAFRKMLLQIINGGLPGGNDLLLPHCKSHLSQFLHINGRIFRGIVCQENIVSAGLFNLCKELLSAVYPLLPQINGAVHVQRETLHLR